jgi:hypothetical protein
MWMFHAKTCAILVRSLSGPDFSHAAAWKLQTRTACNKQYGIHNVSYLLMLLTVRSRAALWHSCRG